MVFARLRTPATKGFLAFTAACAVGWGVLAYLSDTALLPAGAVSQGSPVIADPAWDVPRRAALVVFLACAILTTVVLSRGGRGLVPAVAGVAAGLAVLLLGRSPGAADRGLVGARAPAVVLTLATGGVFAAMILGPLVPGHAQAARGAAGPGGAPAVLGRGAPGRAVRDLGGARDRAGRRPAGRSRRCSGRGRCSCGSG